jgi:Transposase DDE domain group 1
LAGRWSGTNGSTCLGQTDGHDRASARWPSTTSAALQISGSKKKAAIRWTHAVLFAAKRGSPQFHALAYNLGNFVRTLAMSKAAEPWSLTSLREKMIKIGAKVVSHGRYVTFQMAEVAVPRQMFHGILRLIARLRVPPAPG